MDTVAVLPKQHQLKKALGVAFGIAVLIGGTIGVGILRNPGAIAQMLGDPWLIIACWIFGGVYVLMGVGSYAELATMLPKAGGAYNYVKFAFGNYAGFLTGWYDYVLNGIAPAYFCIVIAEYIVLLFPSLEGNETFIAIGFLLAFTILHLGGIRNGSLVQQVTSLVKVLFFALLITACFVLSNGHTSTSSGPLSSGALTGSIFFAILRSLQLVVGTYDGWMSMCFFAEEDKDPGKNIPKSLLLGALLLIFLYLLINAAFLYVLPVAEMANSPLVAADVSARLFGAKGSLVVTVICVFSLISILNAYMMIPARVLYGLSRDKFFFPQGTLVNKGGTPIVALLFSSALSFFLILWGSFEALFSLGAFMSVIVMAFTFASVIRLRSTAPRMHRPYKAWGYPWTTVLMIVFSIGLFLGFAYSDRNSLLIIAVISVLSYPLYRLCHKFL